ncbi:hydrogen peroxide-inducible genes activator [Gynurincola endophyticus]|uniref:hydrogen peroxide-inducible genes activator n=1 Tax=Gynurincola endophyticus TaxID=2479004 RepID=UPI000F8C4059|nr:hydrogen peroxide-inducible genes activator [Gynurincola endophyticus]
MTFIQLEYIVAVDTYRHFAEAANRCFVTQPTLSMQIQKLEDELKVKIFDRSKQPVMPTEIGKTIIEQARTLLADKERLFETVNEHKGILSGELKIGIIPTLAPYLLPLFIQRFNKSYPNVKLIVQEGITTQIIQLLKEGVLDAGVVVTPLNEKGISEHVLFYEELLVYASKSNQTYKKNYVLAKDIDPNELWLLEEGHCFRSQIMNLCELRKDSLIKEQFEYRAGSIEALRRMVELNEGITILPELSVEDMDPKRKKMIRPFKKPQPMREVSIITHRDFVKKRMIEALASTILQSVPEKVLSNSKNNIVKIKEVES